MLSNPTKAAEERKKDFKKIASIGKQKLHLRAVD